MKYNKYPPGPDSLMSINNLLSYSNNPAEFFLKIAKRYGDISYFKLGTQEMVLLNEPELIKKVLLTDHYDLIKGKAFELAKSVIGKGLLTSEGDFHKQQRKFIQPAFNSENLKKYSSIMINLTTLKCNEWKNAQIVNIEKEMMDLSLKTVARTLFTSDIADDSQRIQDSLTVFVDLFNEMTNPVAFLISLLFTKKKKVFEEAKRVLDEIILRMINERRINKKSANDLLAVLLYSKDENGNFMPDQQVVDELMTIFTTGHETIANALTWALYLISIHPEVEKEVLFEIENTIGNNVVSHEDLHKLKYIKNVMTETMRLYPPSWVICRRPRDTYTIEGYTFNKDTIISMSQYVMHRDKRYFNNPHLFKPSRWTESMKKELPRFSYFPFGGGPRICIGENYAWMQGILALVIILQKWKLKLIEDYPVEANALVTLRPKYGVKVQLFERI